MPGFSKVATIGGLVALLSAALLIRSLNLGTWQLFENDEYAWLLSGTSLVQHGIPESWTIYYDTYPSWRTITYGGQDHAVVSPWLDHPPLFSAAVGLWATITNQDSARPLNWAALRLPFVFLAALTILITTLFTRHLLGTTAAFITLATFAFFPAHVIASRFIVAESVIAFFLITALYLFTLIDAPDSRRAPMPTRAAVSILAVLCTLALLLKLSAAIIPATIGLLALLRKNYTVFITTIAASIISILLLAAYGFYYDWSLFTSILADHGSRPQSFWHFWSIITQLDLGYFILRDPALIVGFIGLVAYLANQALPARQRLYIFAPLFVISLLFLLIAPVESYGWYKYMLFPLLAIGVGYVFHQLYRGHIAYFILILPLVAMLLEHSQVITLHESRRLAVVILYGLVAFLIIGQQHLPQLKRANGAVAIMLLALTLFLQASWLAILPPIT